MKNVYLHFAVTALLLAAALTGLTQSIQPAFYNQVDAFLPGENGEMHLIISGLNKVEGLPLLQAQRVLPGGQTKTITLLQEGIPLGYDVLPTVDGYLIAASFFQCDIRLGWNLYKVDFDGSLLWTKDPGVPSDPEDRMKLLPGPGATFWLFRDGLVPLQYSKDGELVESGPFPLPVFRGFCPALNNRYLVYGSAGLALYAPNLLSYQFGLPATDVLDAETLPDGRFAVLSPDSLFLLDPDFNILQQTKHPIPSGQRVDMTLAGGALRLLVHTSPKQMLRIDSNTLNLLETVSIPATAPFQPQYLLGSDNQLFIAGTELPLPGIPEQVIALRAFPAANTPDFGATADAASVELFLPKLPVGKNLSPPPGYSMQLDSASILLKNEGNAPLQTVTINGVLGFLSWFCGKEEQQYRKTFTSLNLLPGNSLQLPLGNMQWDGLYVVPQTVTLCFWTTLPNDSLDANPANNQICRVIPVTVSTKNPVPLTGNLHITPNPMTTESRLEWDNGAFSQATIRAYNARGQLVRSEQTNGASWIFRRGTLAAGLYNVLIRNEDGRLFAGRLLVE